MATKTVLEFQKLTIDDTELINFVAEEVHAVGWRTGLDDIAIHVAFSDPGLYIAKLDDTPVGCICFRKYSSSYYTAGYYIVNEKYRGKGYGLQMC